MTTMSTLHNKLSKYMLSPLKRGEAMGGISAQSAFTVFVHRSGILYSNPNFDIYNLICRSHLM